MSKNFFLSVSVAVLLSLSGCGGGGGEASNNPDFIIVVTGDSSK